MGIFNVGNWKLFKEELDPFSPVKSCKTNTVRPAAIVLMAVPQRTEFAFKTR